MQKAELDVQKQKRECRNEQIEKVTKIVGGYHSMNVEGVVEESFSLDTEVPPMSPIAIFLAFSLQGSAQHTRSI
ncbi:unnamed protein product [Ceratitis capitata]|uniref:(Mediterranean fruit fly) hypothetical protein n=1 Tax=Ceratitis capitata TaxID=7213 RepID=A0A811URI7_CERCA|nr:unnamed protein product [Ceratitis capitata]